MTAVAEWDPTMAQRSSFVPPPVPTLAASAVHALARLRTSSSSLRSSLRGIAGNHVKGLEFWKTNPPPTTALVPTGPVNAFHQLYRLAILDYLGPKRFANSLVLRCLPIVQGTTVMTDVTDVYAGEYLDSSRPASSGQAAELYNRGK
ncbi:uncharacterized protein LTR77_006545 [Saxophila tyrrhenica]|uniref:Uncharacterized protein n=1 Tax=Saxophila tyrrhenica TaxID=1690608 RepID=A0AAV9P8X7_9PEZI|nr:hypothetical protein LTR77_006545 [Saxophila tyrrhenica]